MFGAFFRHGSNLLLAAAMTALAALFAAGAIHFSWVAAIAGALAFFTSEYTTHRFLFHARPSDKSWIRKLQHRLHYDHHADPGRLDLLFLPPWFTVPVTIVYFAVYLVITQSSALAFSLTFGSLFALVYYEWVHYVAHIAFAPVTPYGRWIKKYHLWHHFKNERLWFGVTNPSVDLVMRTYRPVQDVERSESTRDIWKNA